MKYLFQKRVENSQIRVGKFSDKWVPVTTTWRVLTLRMEELPPVCRVAANILHK